MRDEDRKLAWAAIVVLAVFAFEVAWFLLIGRQNPAADHAASQEAKNLFLGLAGEDWTAIFTGVLTVSTIGLWISTASSVRLARDEFTAAHPPELVMRDVRWEPLNEGVNHIAFTLANRGGSAATITESIFRVRSSLNQTETIDPTGNELPITLKPGEFRPVTTAMVSEGEQVMAEAAMMAILETHYFRGTIIYANPKGDRRRMVFVRECKRGDMHFGPVLIPDIDYTD